MAKGYWVSCYRAVHDPAKLGEYAKLAGPAIEKHHGRFVVRGTAHKAYEHGIVGRTVVVEFDSVQAAEAAHDSPEYGAALKALEGAVERDFRIVEGAA